MSEKKFSCTIYDANKKIIAYVSDPMAAAILVLNNPDWVAKSHGRTLWDEDDFNTANEGEPIDPAPVAVVIEKRWREEPIKKSVGV